MSELRSIVESLRAESLVGLPDARIEDDFAELHSAMQSLEAERLRRLAEIDRRRLFERDGHLSTASWLTSRFQMAWGIAKSDVQMARSLLQMETVRHAVEAGTVSLSALRVLAEARAAEPTAFDEAEPFLAEAASCHSVSDLRRIVARWRSVVERERASGDIHDDLLLRRRRLHASVTLEGMVRLDGDLDPESGESLLTALRAVLDADVRSGDAADAGSDDRTPAQKRADALGEICRGWLSRSDRPAVAGERPHLNVTVPLDALHDLEGVGTRAGAGVGEFDHTGPIGLATLRRLACDATVSRLVLGSRSEPLDVGRRTPVVPTSIRRALVARDRTCRFPGCDRPHSWCDAHHVRHWADGGETSVGNLVLLCRRHHRLTHSRFSVEASDGRPVFRRSDGSVLESRAERAPP